ncbi:MAG: M23 family metallopeptidase [Alphaproteobacteria bacterium]
MAFIRILLCFGTLFIAGLTNKTVQAQPPEFIFPVDCVLDETCWAVNYVDMDPAENSAEDFRCGPKTYEGHKGTDFALKSRAEMRSGVNVLAAKAGRVERLRDGEDDSLKSEADFERLRELRKECGNGIFIDHGAAIKTIYCHLKEGSIKVAVGDKVEAGDIIAQIGQSGIAEFPHLHFGILWENSVMDPYSGMTNSEGCGGQKRSLWKSSEEMLYTPVSIYDGGFRMQAPDFKSIEEGEKDPQFIPANTEAFVFWTAFYGVQKDDAINLKITDSQGRIFVSQDITQPKDRARQYYFTGRRLNGKTLPAGEYKGIATLNRAGIAPREKEFIIEIQ